MKIYAITNAITGDQYVGSETRPGSRRKTHLWRLRRGDHHSIYLQRAFDTYGESAFLFSTLEDGLPDNATMLKREQHYMDTLSPVYNMCKVAGNTRGAKRSEEAKKKTRETLREGYASGRLVASRPMLGKHHSAETRRKISEAGRGLKRSSETRGKLSLARLGKKATAAQIAANRQRNLGRKASAEAIAAMRAAQARRTEWPKASAEARMNMSESQKRRWAARKQPAGVAIPGSAQ